jgi:hypothetical protein
LAELFVIHVFSKHGVPAHVTSDWGSEFVSHFFRSLGKALNMMLNFTSGYHLEWWTNWVCQPDTGTISPHLLQLSAEQLEITTASSWVCL